MGNDIVMDIPQPSVQALLFQAYTTTIIQWEHGLVVKEYTSALKLKSFLALGMDVMLYSKSVDQEDGGTLI
tara:strand:+ start:608 stop:820 length:213 start_codon:yes stop_codon:yes gene_type:complete